MNLTAKLLINGELQDSFPLYHDTRDAAKNQFTVRKWISSLSISEHHKVQVTFYDTLSVISRLDLLPHVTAGKLVFTASQDIQERYLWGSLTKGYGPTWGFTAGILLRRKPRTEPALIEEQGKLFAMWRRSRCYR